MLRRSSQLHSPLVGGGDLAADRRIRYRVAWLALTVVLTLQIRFDFLRLLDPVYKAQFQLDSDGLVQKALQDPHHPLFGTLLLPDGEPYLSQFGLQGMVMAWLSPGDQLYGAFRIATALLTAAVLAAAVVACWRAWGGRAAAVLLLFLTTSWWLNAFGLSTYWQLWTMLLPTLLPMLIWPKLGAGRRKWLRGGALIAALVFLKCLCGYEFISTMLLAVAAGVAFHEFRGRFDLKFLRTVVGAGLAGLVGFLGALAVHIAQLVVMFGSADHIWERVTARTFEPQDTAPVLALLRSWNEPVWGWLVADSDNPFRLWLLQAINYLISPAVELPDRPFAGFGPVRYFGFGPSPYAFPVWVFIVIWALLAVQAFRGRQADAAIQRRLAVAAGLGLLGAWSWLVLAYGHMVFHLHIDTIVFYLPFLPLVYVMIAIRVQTISLRAWPRRSAARRASPDPVELPPVPPSRVRELAGAVGGPVDRP